MAKKVFIGVGHGGSDPGAVANGIREKDVNLVIALSCRQELVRHGVEVGISRTKDEDDKTVVKECNAFKPDYAVDIPNNAGGGDGCEIYHHYKGGDSKTLAQNILNSIVKETGQNSRGLKTRKNVWGKDYFAFIRETVCPAVIVECAFLDNKKDVQIVDTSIEQKDMGKAIAKGILKELGIAYKEEKKVESTTTSKKLYKVQVGSYSVKANATAMVKKLKAAGFDAIIV
jgi:N-acetylmuramoyl-L-alanine amidase